MEKKKNAKISLAFLKVVNFPLQKRRKTFLLPRWTDLDAGDIVKYNKVL